MQIQITGVTLGLNWRIAGRHIKGEPLNEYEALLRDPDDTETGVIIKSHSLHSLINKCEAFENGAEYVTDEK